MKSSKSTPKKSYNEKNFYYVIKKKLCQKSRNYNLFEKNRAIEDSKLIYNANQLTGFYVHMFLLKSISKQTIVRCLKNLAIYFEISLAPSLHLFLFLKRKLYEIVCAYCNLFSSGKLSGKIKPSYICNI